VISLGTLPPMMPTILLSSLRCPEASYSSFLECPHPALFTPWQPRAFGEAVAFTNLKRRITSHAEISIPAILFWTTGLSSPVALNQISNQITNDAGVPLDLEHAYTKLSGDTLAGSGGVLRMLPDRRPITTLEREHVRADTLEPLTSGGCM